MFRIHEEQMQRLAERSRHRFVARMADYLERAYPESVGDLSRGELEAWVREGVEKAERYGIGTEPEVAQLVLLVLGLDADETEPWAREALADPNLQGVGKVRALAREARARAIEGIEQVLVVPEVGAA